MHTIQQFITEAELLLAIQYRAIKRLRIEETENESYITHVLLTKEEDEKTLITQRKHPREWASLDRLIKHIRNNYGNVGTITLTLSNADSRQQPE